VTVDVLVVGGGLAGSLASWRLAALRPELRCCLVEGGPRLGGNHTWSFHDTDLAHAARQWTAPLVAARWPRHEVRFPSGRRVLSGGYASITSDRLHEVIAPALGERLRLGRPVAEVDVYGVTLDSGERIQARLVLDARGGGAAAMPAAWQTFVGQDLEFEGDHGLQWPILMDATVPQTGAFRFIYVLPWGPRAALVEDTAYADSPAIDAGASRRAIAAYVAAQGWRVRAVGREETGALPLPLEGRVDEFWPAGDRVARLGTRAGLFHPTTGYSLPDAVATADALAGMDLRDANGVYEEMKRVAYVTWRRRGFFRLLNRLLFRAAASPEQRYKVLEQFYRRPEDLIRRFYAGDLGLADRVRVLAGRPPVPMVRALGVILKGER
jgi:lycopene beta-cyclase